MMLATARLGRQASRRLVRQSTGAPCRYLSTTTTTTKSNDYDKPTFDFQASPPEKLTTEMAEGVADVTHFYIRHGLSNRSLQALSKDEEMPVVIKWQKMMEIFLTTQVHVIAGLGYGADEAGLTLYAQQLVQCLQEADETMRELLTEVRRDTWRDLVATCFDLDAKNDIPTLSIVDARNLMHKVSSKMMEPAILLEIQNQTSKIEDEDPEVEVAKKHQVLQQIIVNEVYLGGDPSLTEEAGFGSGPKGYAIMQCALSDHEGDPLMAQYASAAMMRIWQAAGLDLSSIEGPGIAGGAPGASPSPPPPAP